MKRIVVSALLTAAVLAGAAGASVLIGFLPATAQIIAMFALATLWVVLLFWSFYDKSPKKKSPVSYLHEVNNRDHIQIEPYCYNCIHCALPRGWCRVQQRYVRVNTPGPCEDWGARP